MSRAVTLANLASGEALTIDETNDRVGIASTTPDATLDIKNTILMDGDAGVITATNFSGDVTGVAATFTGAVSIGGTLTYEDVTQIDSVGIVTAGLGVRVLAGGINVAGVVTATSDIRASGNLNAGIATFSGAVQANATTDSTTKDTGSLIVDGGVGVEKNIVAGGDVRITGNINAGISTLTGKATVGSVTLQHSDIVAGVVTATSYKGDGAALTGLPAGFSWIEGNLF